jgi:hypothetical protein
MIWLAGFCAYAGVVFLFLRFFRFISEADSDVERMQESTYR